MNEKNKSLLWGALVGSIVGSVTALLLAPKSGKELRSDIAGGARAVGGKTQEWAGLVKDKAGNVISDIQTWRKTKLDGDEDETEDIAQISSFADEDEEDVEDLDFASVKSAEE